MNVSINQKEIDMKLFKTCLEMLKRFEEKPKKGVKEYINENLKVIVKGFSKLLHNQMSNFF